MRALVLLVAVSACSAQQVWPYMAPWALPSELLTTPEINGEVKPLTLTNPLVNPYINPGQFTFMWKDPKAEEAAKQARRRRDVSLPLSYIHPLPALAKTTVETKQLEPVEAPTPAHTTKLELTTKEHEFTIPTVRYTQPLVNYKPVEYTAISMPFQPGFPVIAAKEALRRRRDVSLPLPYIHTVPALAKTTVETKQFEPVEADTPADTTMLELTTKEHELTIPTVRYMQPIVNYKPVKYTAISPVSVPFQTSFPVTA